MSLGSISGPTLPTSGLGDCDQSLWIDCGWPAVGQQFQTGQASPLDQWGASFTGNTNDSGVPTVVPAPSHGKHFFPLSNFNTPSAHPRWTVPLQYWGDTQSGPSTSTFNLVSVGFCSSFHYFADTVCTSNQPSPGPSRTGQNSQRRFQPYTTSRARENEHRNAEAGLSTPVPVQVLHAGSTTLQPTGGVTPETAANANQANTTTEAERVPVSHFYRSPVPRVADLLCGVRFPSAPGDQMARANLARAVRQNRLTTASCVAWSRDGKGSQKCQASSRLCPVSTSLRNKNDASDVVGHDSEVVDYIPTVQVAVSEHPRLVKGNTKPSPGSSERAQKEQRRRDRERALFEQLSRYYQLDSHSGRVVWERPSLLKKGKRMLNSSSRERRPTDSRTISARGSQGSPSSTGTCQHASSLNFGVNGEFCKYIVDTQTLLNSLTVYFWSLIHEFFGLVGACAGGAIYENARCLYGNEAF